MSDPGPGWKPITTAPLDGRRLSVWSPTMGESIAWWLGAAEVWAEELGSGYMAPHQGWTHWRPCPNEHGRERGDDLGSRSG